MAQDKAFEFIILVCPKGGSRAWLVEDRKHPYAGDPSRATRLPLDIGTADVAGVSVKRIAYRLAHALTAAMEESRDPGYF